MPARNPEISRYLAFVALVVACGLAGVAALRAEGDAIGLLLAALSLAALALGAWHVMPRRTAGAAAGASAPPARAAGPLLDALPAGVLLFDASGMLQHSNRIWRDFCQAHNVVLLAGAETLTYHDFSGAFSGAEGAPGGADALAGGIGSVLADEVPGFEGEFALQTGAQTRWLRITAHPYIDDGARTIAVMTQDVTERRLAEERRDLLGAALNASAHAVVITDASAVIEWANPAFGTLAGRSAEATVGATPAELLRSDCDNAAPHPASHGNAPASSATCQPGQPASSPPPATMGPDGVLTITPVRDRDGVLRHFVAIGDGNRERTRADGELPQHATLDALTGLRNRRAFLDEVKLERARVRRYGRRSALLVLDIDHFAHINDAHGRSVGDAALRHFARLLATRTRQADVIGRLDGETFGILLPETDLEGAMEFGERLRHRVDASVIHCAMVDVRLTVSIGIAGFKREDRDVGVLLARASSAVRLAKNGGRNRVECAQAE